MSRPIRLTRRQRTSLAGCFWGPCPGCNARVPMIKAAGVPASGFGRLHKADCRVYFARRASVAEVQR